MHNVLFNKIISLENLFIAWNNFKRGKRKREEIQIFEMYLEDNIFRLHNSLKNFKYKHGKYKEINICDTKPRIIHKASTVDRLVHQAVFQVIYDLFDKKFIYDSYSCRNDKGTHGAIFRLDDFIRKGTCNYNKNLYFLKFDIKKYFNNIDHEILLSFIEKTIKQESDLSLIKEIIKSFRKLDKRGIPLGNITSQLFANIYLNELDYFIKHKLKIKYYIRYCDDFIILSNSYQQLGLYYKLINDYLIKFLKLELKTSLNIGRVKYGVDFLGYITYPKYRLIRNQTKKRMFNNIINRRNEYFLGNISRNQFNSYVQSYLGLIKHCDDQGLEDMVRDLTRA